MDAEFNADTSLKKKKMESAVVEQIAILFVPSFRWIGQSQIANFMDDSNLLHCTPPDGDTLHLINNVDDEGKYRSSTG